MDSDKWGLAGDRGSFYRQQEPIQLSLLNNAKVKRNGNYGVAVWKHRRGGATPFSAFPPLKRSRAAQFPHRQDHRAFYSPYSLFTSVVGSKMSNLSHHNNYTPHLPCRSITCSHNAADKMFRLPDSGMPRMVTAQPPGGCLLADIMPSCTFIHPTRSVSGYSAAVYEQKKSLSFHLSAKKKKKARLTPNPLSDAS